MGCGFKKGSGNSAHPIWILDDIPEPFLLNDLKKFRYGELKKPGHRDNIIDLCPLKIHKILEIKQ